MNLLIFLVVAFLLAGLLRTWQMDQSGKQKEFAAGTLPHPLPDGLHAGTVDGYAGSWKGKIFDRDAQTGINLFGEDGKDKRYPFQTYASKGLRDPTVSVLRIDYDAPKNPFWVRMVLDEIVQTGPDAYLGKVHVRALPGIPFTVGYFRLKK